MIPMQAVQGPDLGQIFSQGLNTYGQIKGMQQQQQFADIKDKERFAKESSQFAASVKDLPPERKLQAMKDRVQMLKDRGDDPATTERMMNDYEQGLQAQNLIQSGGGLGPMDIQAATSAAQNVEKVDNALKDRYAFGIQAGYIKAPEKAKGMFRPATKEEKQQFGVPVDQPYQIGADNKIIPVENGKGQTIINQIGNGQLNESEFQKQMGKDTAAEFKTVKENALQAEEQNYTLDEIEAMDVKTGALEPLKNQLGAIGESLGIDMSSIANVAGGQAYDAKGKKMVLGEMQKQKGPQTESDMKMISKTVTNLGNTPEANKFIIKSIKAQNLRKIEERDFKEQWIADGKPAGKMNRAWNKYKRDVPMISKNLKNPDGSGLPMFYHQFEKLAREQDPNARRVDIIKEWKKMDAAAKKVSVPTKKVIDSARKIPLSINATYGPQKQSLGGQYGEPVRESTLTGRFGL